MRMEINRSFPYKALSYEKVDPHSTRLYSETFVKYIALKNSKCQLTSKKSRDKTGHNQLKAVACTWLSFQNNINISWRWTNGEPLPTCEDFVGGIRRWWSPNGVPRDDSKAVTSVWLKVTQR